MQKLINKIDHMNKEELQSLLKTFINQKATTNSINLLAEIAGLKSPRVGSRRHNWSQVELPLEIKVAAPYLRRLQSNRHVLSVASDIISVASKTHRPSIELIFMSLQKETKSTVLNGAINLPYRERLDIATMLKIAGFKSHTARGSLKSCELIWTPLTTTKNWTANDRHEHFMGVMAALDKLIESQTQKNFNNII